MITILLVNYLVAYDVQYHIPSIGHGTAHEAILTSSTAADESTTHTPTSVNPIDKIFLSWFRRVFGRIIPHRVRDEDKRRLEMAFNKV